MPVASDDIAMCCHRPVTLGVPVQGRLCTQRDSLRKLPRHAARKWRGLCRFPVPMHSRRPCTSHLTFSIRWRLCRGPHLRSLCGTSRNDRRRSRWSSSGRWATLCPALTRATSWCLGPPSTWPAACLRTRSRRSWPVARASCGACLSRLAGSFFVLRRYAKRVFKIKSRDCSGTVFSHIWHVPTCYAHPWQPYTKKII